MKRIKYIFFFLLTIAICILARNYYIFERLTPFELIYYSFESKDFNTDYKYTLPLGSNRFYKKLRNKDAGKINKQFNAMGINLYYVVGSVNDSNTSEAKTSNAMRLISLLQKKGLTLMSLDDKGCNTYDHVFYHSDEEQLELLDKINKPLTSDYTVSSQCQSVK